MANKHSTQPFDNPGKLMSRVLELLEKDPRTNPEIFRDTRIPLNWLNGLTRGDFRNPSVNRLEYLYEQLSGKELEL